MEPGSITSEHKAFRPLVIVLSMMHAAGVIGLLSPWHDLFAALTPFHLISVFVFLLIFQKRPYRQFWVFASVIIAGSWLLEWAGVSTGMIFGEYSYGHVLGPSVAGTPIIIGINWFILLFSIGCVLQSAPWGVMVRSAIGALIMTSLDVLIEPVAIEFEFWDWSGAHVPLLNYVAWFVASFLFLLLFNTMRFDKSNRIAPWVLGLQSGFFLIINIFLVSRG